MADNTIPAVEKTLALVEILGNNRSPLSKKTIEKKLDISASTCYRILCTLLDANWVKRDTDGDYSLSSGLISAAKNLFEFTARYERLQPILNHLSEETGLSCKFSIRRGSYQITLLRAESKCNIQVSGRVGAEFPLIEGSVGAALLSRESAEQLKEMLRSCPENIMEKRDPDLLQDRVRQVREEGVCLNRTPNRWRIHAMSAPVSDSSGVIAGALTLLGWDEDLTEKECPALRKSLLKYAKQCTETLTI